MKKILSYFMEKGESFLRGLRVSLNSSTKKAYSIEVLPAAASNYRKKIHSLLVNNDRINTFEELVHLEEKVPKGEYLEGVLTAGRFLLLNTLIEECYIFLNVSQERVEEVYGEPVDFSLFEEIGNMFYLSGQCTQAIAWYQKLMDMNEAPESRMFFNIGLCFQIMENFPLAVESYVKSTNADPKFYKSWINLGFCYTRIGKPELAVFAYQQLPLSAENLLCMGNALFYNGRFEDALAYYLRSVELKEDSGTYNNLGVVLKKLKLFQDSICAFADSLAIRPNSEAAANLITLYVELGKKNEAFAVFNMCKNVLEVDQVKKFRDLIEKTFPARLGVTVKGDNFKIFSSLMRRNTAFKSILTSPKKNVN
jgi:tetratricopeptide (TPR) repeat protein